MKRIFPIIITLIMLVAISGCSLPVLKENTIADSSTLQDQLPGDGTIGQTDAAETAGNTGGVAGGQDGIAESSTVQGTSTGVKMVPITLYYQEKGGLLVPVTRKVEKQDGIARTALNGLIDNAHTREELEYYGLYPVLPAGTEILGIKITDGLAVVDFSAKLLESPDETAEKRVLASIVYTLTEFKTVDRVELRVNGKPLDKMKYDTGVSNPLKRENVPVNATSSFDSTQKKKLDIYLFRNMNEKFSYLLPVSIPVSVSDVKKLPAEIVRLLAENYEKQGLSSEVPEGTDLLESQLDGNVLSLDFNKALKSYGGGSA